jgi:hypothetical protein
VGLPPLQQMFEDLKQLIFEKTLFEIYFQLKNQQLWVPHKIPTEISGSHKKAERIPAYQGLLISVLII